MEDRLGGCGARPLITTRYRHAHECLAATGGFVDPVGAETITGRPLHEVRTDDTSVVSLAFAADNTDAAAAANRAAADDRERRGAGPG
jgi:hypothetical protein